MSGWFDRLLIQGLTWGSTDADHACAVACYCGLAVLKPSTANIHYTTVNASCLSQPNRPVITSPLQLIIGDIILHITVIKPKLKQVLLIKLVAKYKMNDRINISILIKLFD
jgi:hypothetical protein